eukprot:TRINITY_DN137_c0_g1_i1.p1 TRINITY_DN137_c0_g1~~TRINITY_DN137_c0_g1_i1.p1  ORF type:complete len:680 (-),score=249.87 TRINITY_DN137_c0_g1_i1:266-2305(-)
MKTQFGIISNAKFAVLFAILTIFALQIDGKPQITSRNLKALSEMSKRGERMEVLVGFKQESTSKRIQISEEEKNEMGWIKVSSELESINQAYAQRKRIVGSSEHRIDVIQVKKIFQMIPSALFSVDSEGWNEIQNMNTLEYIELNEQRELFLQEANDIIGSSRVWNPARGGQENYDGRGYTVAVLDDGFNTQNPLISSKIVGEACTLSTNNASIVCPNGQQTQIGTGAAAAASGSIHGTHCSGIVAGNNVNTGLKGAAPGANLYLINVFGSFRGGKVDTASDSSILAGLQQVYNQRNNFKFAAVSMSLGGGKSQGYCDTEIRTYTSTFVALRNVGIAVVIASGNSFFKDGIAYPSCSSVAVSVGATTKGDSVTSFSNSHRILSLLAPGVFIYSSTTASGLNFLSGTSMATPMVAGSYAVLRSVFGDAPTVDSLTKRFKDTGKLITDRNGVTTSRLSLIGAVTGKRWACGDGTIGDNEQCDDGNVAAGDGCSASCGIEWGYNCQGTPSICTMATVTQAVVSNQLLGNAESNANPGNWERVNSPASRVYAGSWSYGSSNGNGDSSMSYSFNIPAANLSATSGRRTVLNFRLKTEWDSTQTNCPSSFFVVANGLLIESKTLAYNANTLVSNSNPSYYPGTRGFCIAQADNTAWNLVSMDVTSFQGKATNFQFIVSGDGGDFF